MELECFRAGPEMVLSCHFRTQNSCYESLLAAPSKELTIASGYLNW